MFLYHMRTKAERLNYHHEGINTMSDKTSEVFIKEAHFRKNSDKTRTCQNRVSANTKR